MRFILTLTVLFFSCVSSAQIGRTYNWYFGDSAGVRFKGGIQADLAGKLQSVEGCSSISDTCGDLLFYTQGITVYDKTHVLMQNGTGLDSYNSAPQRSFFVPQPGNDSIYFIFTGGLLNFCY